MQNPRVEVQQIRHAFAFHDKQQTDLTLDRYAMATLAIDFESGTRVDEHPAQTPQILTQRNRNAVE